MAGLWHLKAKGYRRAIIEVHPANLPSIKGVEAAGFSRPREVRLWILLNSLVIRRTQDCKGKQWRAFFV
jgi:RimJ/RimL family protein N-acetyltransferase